MCTREAQQVPSVPRMGFFLPIGGRLEDLTSTCVSTFHHAADTFVLNNDDVSSFAVPLVDPPVGNRVSAAGRGRVTPLPTLSVLETSALSFGEGPAPPIVTMVRKDPKRSPWTPAHHRKPGLVGMEKILRPVCISGRDSNLPGG